MAPKKNRKQPQDSVLEEPIDDQVAPPESIGEEEPMPRKDRDEPESEEEQKSSVLFTPEQLEVLLKMGRPDFGELVVTLKTGAAKGERFQLAKLGNFDGARDRKVVDAWLAELKDYIHVATPLWPSVGVKPNTWKSWRLRVFRDSRMFRARQQAAKHLALGCSWCRSKGLET
jgi:hypothetical protein